MLKLLMSLKAEMVFGHKTSKMIATSLFLSHPMQFVVQQERSWEMQGQLSKSSK